MSNSSVQTTTKPTPVIDTSGTQMADIILTRNEETQSKAIRVGTCSAYSHAILVLDNGDCIEAVGSGTGIRPLRDALVPATYGVLFRHKAIDANHAGWVTHYARSFKGRPYDKMGAIRSGTVTGCSPWAQLSPVGLIVNLVDHKMKNDGSVNDLSFFCSELIARAFEKAGIPLLNARAHMATARAIARSNHLQYVKDVVKV